MPAAASMGHRHRHEVKGTTRQMTIDEHDKDEQRCRMLGHPVPFGYCRQLPEGKPCRLIIECWQGQFDVSAFLSEHFTRDEIEQILAPPKPKLTSIIELIEKARRAADKPET